MKSYTMTLLVLVGWVGNAVYCFLIVRRAAQLPKIDAEGLVARYGRWSRRPLDFEKLKGQLPQMEMIVPDLWRTALVPLAIAAAFAVNGLARIVWIKDGTEEIWFAAGLIFLATALPVYLLAWEQLLRLRRLRELAYGPSGVRVRDYHPRQGAETEAPTEQAGPIFEAKKA